jgi:heptaprenyl diphosphate synthase
MATAEAPPAGPYDRARSLVGRDLERVEARLEAIVRSQAEYLGEEELAFYAGGKRLRPLLLLLSAHVAAHPPAETLPDKAITAAVSLELSHVGSLIHDDIVDRAPMRRGLPTLSASRGYELALVIGDLHWVQATRLMSAHVETREDILLMRDFLDRGEQTCRGQLDEMLSGAGGAEEEMLRRYYRTIDRKTGQLLSFACEGGARLMDGMPSVVGGLRRFGSWLGRAFQVMDDVIDVVRPAGASDKEPLADLRQGRLSLPLIYTLAELEPDHFLQRIATGGTLNDGELAAGVEIVRGGAGWIRAISDARAVVARARLELDLLPAGEHRDALDAIAAHIVDQGFLGPERVAVHEEGGS